MAWGKRRIRFEHPWVTGVAVGRSALSLRVAGPEQAASLAAWLRSTHLGLNDAGGIEIVPAATTVLVDGVLDEPAVLEAVSRWRPGHTGEQVGQVVCVPVTYDGADLELIARLWEVEVSEVVARHTGVEFVATFSGFSPGFSYLAGLPAQWALPRLESPRARVPAGSVAMAHRWCGIYPSSSPGGWLLLGRTELAVWDPASATSPSLLSSGTRVRFTVA